ncbi:MAG: LysE family translocator [Oceanipulchritudo sp.]
MELVFSIALIHLLACLSPGPDIFLVVLNSLRHGWRTGVATTAGILTGVAVQITIGITGISYLVTRSPGMESAVGLAGGAWLVYLGGRGLLPGKGQAVRDNDGQVAASGRSAWLQGLLVNLLNPKALLFFLSLFSVMLGPDVPLPIRVACGLTMLGVQAAAFTAVAFLLDRPRFKDGWIRLQFWLDRAISLILLLLGGWIWITTLLSHAR